MFRSGGHGQYDKLLEKATSNLLLEPDWGSIMAICDLIRQKDCQPKYAIAGIKKKLHHQNPHVVMFGLQVLESIVKNCGSPIHEEVATKQFMEELRELAKTSHHDNVKEKVLELVQTWAHAFRKISSYRAVPDMVTIMKNEGMQFKPLVESDAMFVADTAPEWTDGECCHRCRTEFGLVVRKHHCRACGQIFCGKCSSKQCTLPKFGIEKEVRVCDSCFEKYGKDSPVPADLEDMLMRVQAAHHHTHPRSASASVPSNQNTNQSSQSPSSTTAPSGPRGKTEKELQEEEEEQLQLALAISQSEAEAKEMEAKRKSLSAYTAPAVSANENNAAIKGSPQKSAPEADDPELARYLNRGYWENRGVKEESKEEKVEKNHKSSGGWNSSYSYQPSAPIKENKDKAEQVEEIDSFVENLRGQIEMFVNRMKSNSSRGRPIAYDTSVQGLFMNITALHSQLLNYIQAQDDARGQFEGLQDKLGQIRDARGALDALRFEHAEKLRRQAEEQERIRQFQMAQKLHVMRQKKQEYLQYQRQLAMQRMQEQEREMQMRIEQQTRQLAAGGVPAQGVNPYMAAAPSGGPYVPPGYMAPPQVPGADMSYMQQQAGAGPNPPGQMIPPNVSMGQQGQIPVGPYMMPGQYGHIPQGQGQMMQQMPPQGQAPQVPQSQAQGQPAQPNNHQMMMSPQGQPQQVPASNGYQQPPPQQHPQIQQVPPPQQQQQAPSPPQQQQPVVDINAAPPPPTFQPQAEHVKPEPSTAELISFD